MVLGWWPRVQAPLHSHPWYDEKHHLQSASYMASVALMSDSQAPYVLGHWTAARYSQIDFPADSDLHKWEWMFWCHHFSFWYCQKLNSSIAAAMFPFPSFSNAAGQFCDTRVASSRNKLNLNSRENCLLIKVFFFSLCSLHTLIIIPHLIIYLNFVLSLFICCGILLHTNHVESSLFSGMQFFRT